MLTPRAVQPIQTFGNLAHCFRLGNGHFRFLRAGRHGSEHRGGENNESDEPFHRQRYPLLLTYDGNAGTSL